MGSTNAYRIEGRTITGAAEAAITAAHLVVAVGTDEGEVNLAAAGGKPLGVAMYSADTDSAVAVQIDGLAEVTAGGAITAGNLVYATGSAGKVDDVATGSALGLAITGAAADGEIIVVDLSYKGAA